MSSSRESGSSSTMSTWGFFASTVSREHAASTPDRLRNREVREARTSVYLRVRAAGVDTSCAKLLLPK
jgi:hypothetical protein